MQPLGAAFLWIQAMLLGSMLELVHGVLEWVALAGGAAAAILFAYRKLWRPLYSVAAAAVHAAPILEDLPGRLEHQAEINAHIEQRVRTLEENGSVSSPD